MSENQGTALKKKIADNTQWLENEMGINESFDIVKRELYVGEKKATLIFFDGFTDGDTSTLILQSLMRLKREQIVPNPLQKIFRYHLPFIEVETVGSL